MSPSAVVLGVSDDVPVVSGCGTGPASQGPSDDHPSTDAPVTHLRTWESLDPSSLSGPRPSRDVKVGLVVPVPTVPTAQSDNLGTGDNRFGVSPDVQDTLSMMDAGMVT